MPSLDFDGDYGRSYRQSSGAEPGQHCSVPVTMQR